MVHRTTEELTSALDHILASPAATGTVEMIVRRPAVDEREVVHEGVLDLTEGLVGDNWLPRGNKIRPDGSADPEAQLTLMNSRVIEAIAGARERWPLAGDQIYVDLDLGFENLPTGARLAVGDAVVEVTAEPHNGCAKFSARFGSEALRFVNQPPGRELRFRGVNAKIMAPGTVRVGDRVTKL